VLDKNGQKMSKRLGNAADPFETLEYGPDATRWYMISNANPWDNLKFDLELLRCAKFLEHCTTPIRSLVCMLT
jgi:isoleucyl-tRNA synthetase